MLLIARYSRIGFVDPALNWGNGQRAFFTQKKKSPALKITNRDPGLQQVQTTYDSNSHVILVTAKQRFHDETGTGVLGTASTGVKARVSYAASYFDGADRLTGVVDVGTNGGSSYTRPSTLPSRSDTVLVTTTAYNSAGLAWKRIDPRGIETRGYFNALGDVTKSIENYVDGTVSDTDDKTTESTYNAAGLTTVRVVLPSGGQQVTEWVYGVTTSGGSGLNSNDLVKEVRYPDPSTGASSSSSKDMLTVNALGQALTMTDRNGTVHSYSYDVLAREVADAITTLGSGVDGAVRRIATAYDPLGNASLYTTYDASSGGSIVNQVKRDFNGLGQLNSEWQSHSGAVTGSSPRVQYAYSEMASGANHSRLTSMTYASGYAVNYNYASGLDSNISRLSSLSDASNTLEAYSYLGLGSVVKRAHAQPGVDLSYFKLSTESVGDAGDQYTGLDRFGRVVDQRWINGSNTDVDRYQYGYDRDGNRLYKDNKVIASLSEVYTYDSLNQLASYKLGTLNGTKTDVTGSPATSQSWDYDAVGNWDSVTTNSTTQTRSANKQNEITSVSGATTPTYDSNGNLTTDENNYRFVYDAWNRLVQVKNSSNVVIVTYGRDALHRHVTDTVGSTVTDRFFSSDWQVLETKVGSNTVTRNVWSPVYVDGLVLRDRDTDGNGTLDERLYALQDANWNTTGLVSAGGTVQERYTYTPFGQVTFRDGSGSTLSASAKDWVFLHQGGERIAAGDFEFRNRLYSPSLGRWLSNDPLGFDAGDQNWYRSIGNNPGNGLDPWGLEKIMITADAFIPNKMLDEPWPYQHLYPYTIRKFKGDNREISLVPLPEINSRISNWIEIETDWELSKTPTIRSGSNASNSTAYYYYKKSRRPLLYKTEIGENKPLNPIQESKYLENGEIEVRLKNGGANSLLVAPHIDYDWKLRIKKNLNNKLEIIGAGNHDGFPAYELYVQEILIYGYDPRKTGETPWSLVGSADIKADVPKFKLP